MSAKQCFWCTGMRHLGAFGRWFERRFWECCKRHDEDYITNSRYRAEGWHDKQTPRVKLDDRFFDCLLAKGCPPVIAMVAYVFIRIFYWPSRMVKWLLGRVESI